MGAVSHDRDGDDSAVGKQEMAAGGSRVIERHADPFLELLARDGMEVSGRAVRRCHDKPVADKLSISRRSGAGNGESQRFCRQLVADRYIIGCHQRCSLVLVLVLTVGIPVLLSDDGCFQLEMLFYPIFPSPELIENVMGIIITALMAYLAVPDQDFWYPWIFSLRDEIGSVAAKRNNSLRML